MRIGGMGPGRGLGARGVVGYKPRDSGFSVVVVLVLKPSAPHPLSFFLFSFLPLTLPPEFGTLFPSTDSCQRVSSRAASVFLGKQLP